MNVLFLTTHLNPGGISGYIKTLSAELCKRGFRVTVCSSGGIWEPLIREGGAQVHTIPINTKSEISSKIAWSLFRLLSERQRWDIVHAHTRVTQVLAHMFCKQSNIPYVTTCHSFFKPRLSRRIFPCWGTLSIAISRAVEEHLIEDFHLDPLRVRLVYNGVPPFKRQNDARQQLFPACADKKIIGIISRITESKGQDFLIRVFGKLSELRNDVALVIAGDGSYKRTLEKLVCELHLTDSVFFLERFDKEKLLSCFDLFCLPSTLEGLGICALEAQSAGVPVITTSCGGLKEIVIQKKTGFVIDPPLDINKWVGAIDFMLDEEQLRQECIINAWQMVRDTFSIEAMVNGVVAVYEDAVRMF